MLESYSALAGQFFGLASLALCVLAFASKRDERLLVLLILANVAFALQFLFLESWTAAALTLLVIVRIALARRYPEAFEWAALYVPLERYLREGRRRLLQGRAWNAHSPFRPRNR